MLEEQVKVVAVDHQGVWVESVKVSACAACQSKSSCSQGMMSDMLGSKPVVINVENPSNLVVNALDQAIIGIEEKAFLNMSLLQYLLPIVFMFFAGFAASQYLLAEPWVILCSVLGLLAGLGGVRFVSRWLARTSNYHPILLRVV